MFEYEKKEKIVVKRNCTTHLRQYNDRCYVVSRLCMSRQDDGRHSYIGGALVDVFIYSIRCARQDTAETTIYSSTTDSYVARSLNTL